MTESEADWIESRLSQLTLEEKVALVAGAGGPAEMTILVDRVFDALNAAVVEPSYLTADLDVPGQ